MSLKYEELLNLHSKGLLIDVASLDESQTVNADGSTKISKKFSMKRSDKMINYETNMNCIKQRYKKMNTVLILTGIRECPCQVVVLDIDVKEEDNIKSGIIKWNELILEHGDIDTWKVLTGNGGLHYYFMMEPKLENCCNGTKLSIDGQQYSIDLRGKGGIIFAPPTSYITFDGMVTKSYTWIRNTDTPLMKMPDWLYNIINKTPKNSPGLGPTPTPTAISKKQARQKMKTAVVGFKNETVSLNANNIEDVIAKGFGQIEPIYVSKEEVTKLVNMLNINRADNRDTWIKVGLCLHHMNEDFFEIWNNFSKISKKYCGVSECLKQWNSFKIPSNPLEMVGIGSLRAWAREDNKKDYRKNMLDKCKYELDNLAITDTDMASLLKVLLQDKVKNDPKSGLFYVLKEDGRWVEDPHHSRLNNLIRDESFCVLSEAMSYYKDLAAIEMDENKKDKYEKHYDMCLLAMNKLKFVSIKNKIISELSGMVLCDNFKDKLDANTSILAFNNGVLDLTTMNFRAILPTDYITMTTGYDYISERNPAIEEEIMTYWKQVLRDEATRKFYLICLASCLEGYNTQEIFVILSGVGSNSKGKSSSLVDKTLGNYAGSIKSAYFQNTNEAPTAANSDLANIMKCRFVSSAEPKGQTTKFDCHTIKNWSGRDPISVRQLYHNNETMVPHFTIFLQLNNCPQFDDDGAGILRRIINIEFNSSFVYEPDETKEHEFLRNDDLPNKFDGWRMSFLHILLDHYKIYVANRKAKITFQSIIPESVKINSKELVHGDDPFRKWFELKVKNKKDSYISLARVTEHFSEWFYDNCLGEDNVKMIGKKEIKDKLNKWLGVKCTACKIMDKHCVKNFWMNYSIDE